MNVHISNRALRNAEVEQEINQQVSKLGNRLRVFRPELIHLHVNLEPGSGKKNGGLSVSLNLRLPSDQLTATSLAPQGVSAVKDAFRDLTTQIDSHKHHLRNRRNFNRPAAAQARGVPFEETLAAVKAPAPNPEATDGDIRLYVNTNMADLERFVRRQLRLRVSAGEISPQLVSVEEVLDETVANALDEHAQHPDLMSMEHWLYRLAMEAVDVVAERNATTGEVHIEETRGTQNVSGTDDAYLQYHEDPDQMFVSDFIPDQSRSTPEQVVYSRESITQVGDALACLKKEERDAFVLYALEGFSVQEIATIAQRSEEDIRKSLDNARHALEARLAPDNVYRHLLKTGAQAA
jgi:RNA polymerase sigma factor (sigma-70 family)